MVNGNITKNGPTTTPAKPPKRSTQRITIWGWKCIEIGLKQGRYKMKGVLINLGINRIIGALKRGKEGKSYRRVKENSR